MQRLSYLLALIILPLNLAAQINRTLVSSDTAFHVVSYIDVVPSSRAAAITTLKQYRETSRKDTGYVSMDMFEQMGHPARLLMLEQWSDEKSFDAHATAEHTKQLIEKLTPIRLGFDQR